ncbi:MAG: 2-octaprenyl-6-methoxyphenyl hydroxylase [Wenzhouxiangellaceae bacterium]
MKDGDTTCDVVVAGGGLVGTSLAIGLVRTGFDVVLVEAVARSATAQPSFDDRTLVLNRASLNILTRLGVGHTELPQCPIRTIEVSRHGRFGRVRLAADEMRVERLGSVIVARELGQRLKSRAAEVGVRERCPERVQHFESDGQRMRVRLASGDVLTTSLLVAADGTGSSLAGAAGIRHHRHSYHQSAMIFNVRGRPGSGEVAYERFTDQGVLALLPQPEGRYGCVMIGPDAMIDDALDWPDAQLSAWLAEHAPPGLSGFSGPGKRVRYGLAMQRTAHPVAERIVAVGNAANTVHPVSAQGLNLGLRDVAGLIQILTGHRSDPGSASALAEYVALRQEDQAATVRYTDTLARAFSNPSMLFRIGSGLGLAAHALLPGTRRRLARGAMGYRGQTLQLARESESA